MTSNSPCVSTSPCETSPCANPIAERPRYFPRQIITPDDLTLEQDYFRNKLRRHNRLMHGWGVVCGAKVCRTPQTGTGGATSYQPWMVTVTTGYILGPYGDEILLDCCRSVDVRTSGSTGVTGDPCVQPVDPWCTDVFVQRDTTQPVYIAIKYRECRTRPVRVQPIGCGCNDNTCEYSRLQDGYEIGVLTTCPDAGAVAPLEPSLFEGDTPDCPDCPPQPWVVLAQVTVDLDGTITLIDNCKCRRIVVSFGSFWRQCKSVAFTVGNLKATTAGVDLQKIPPGTSVNMTMNIAGLDSTAKPLADLGPGVTIGNFTATGTAGVWSLDFTPQAGSAGLRTLVVSLEDSSAAVRNAINIVPAGLKPPPPSSVVAATPADATFADTAAPSDSGDGSGGDTPSKKKKKSS